MNNFQELSDEIKQFRKKSNRWRTAFYISSLLLLVLYFVFFVLVKNQPLKDFFTSLDASWSTVIGIIGSIASTVSFFYAITIAYESIITSNQSDKILNKLNTLLEKTNAMSEDTNKLVHTIADATRKSIRGKEQIGKTILEFLEESVAHDKLYILTHTLNANYFSEKYQFIHSIFDRASDVSQLKIKLLKPELLSKHFHLLAQEPETLKRYIQYTNSLPYHLFIREKQGDYSTLIILNGLHNLDSEIAIFIEDDEELCKDLEKVFDGIE